MKSYKDVKDQIARLEKEAEALRQRELKNVIAQVRKTIEQYELTPSDLGLGGAPKARGRKAGAKRGSRGRTSVGEAKYRDPATGKTWTGRGRPPTWMIGVKDPSAYLIDAAVAPAAAAPKKARAAKKAAPKKAAAKKAAAPKKAARKTAKKAAGKSAAKKAPASPAEGGEANG